MRPGFGHLFMSAIQPSTQLVRGVTIERRKSQKSVEWRSKVVVAQRASGFNLEIELKNIILRRVSILSFYTARANRRHSIWDTSPEAASPYVAVADVLSGRPSGATSRPVNSRVADDYLKATSLKSIEASSMSVMGLRSGPRV
jgi:hypothetical protein